jgi:hypothetical protein
VAHKNHPTCEFTSKAACEKARRIAIGQCVAMLDEDHQCSHWGTDTVDGRGYCGQHIGTVVRAADEAVRSATKKAEMNQRIDRALKWHEQHPSVWDRMPL